MDKISPERRSENMRRIRGKNTRPELEVRRLVSSLGKRYRLHSFRLPGRPDIVFSRDKKVIFVHGCFWHMHPKRSCIDARFPKTNASYWTAKLEANALRDRRNRQELRRLGWKALVIWDCELKDQDKLLRKVRRFLE